MEPVQTFIVPSFVGDAVGSVPSQGGQVYGYYFVATGAQEVFSSCRWGTPPAFPGGTYRVVDGQLRRVVPGVPPALVGASPAV